MISYISDSRIPTDENAVQLRSLVSLAQRNNKALGVTGVLFLRGSVFFQIIEGPTGAVKELFQNIRADDRHDSVYTLLDEPIAARRFETWSMESFHDPVSEENFLSAIHSLGNHFLKCGAFNPTSVASYGWELTANMAHKRLSVPPAHLYDPF